MNLTRAEALANPAVAAAMGRQAVAPKAKRGKYGAERTLVDGVWFDSRREGRRYLTLKMLKQAGKILWFARQARFVLPGPAEYVCDFVVAWADGRVTVEDAKGIATKIYRLKKRQVESLYRVKIEER